MKNVWIVYVYWYSKGTVLSRYYKAAVRAFASKEAADEYAKTEQTESDRMKFGNYYEVQEIPFDN